MGTAYYIMQCSQNGQNMVTETQGSELGSVKLLTSTELLGGIRFQVLEKGFQSLVRYVSAFALVSLEKVRSSVEDWGRWLEEPGVATGSGIFWTDQHLLCSCDWGNGRE